MLDKDINQYKYALPNRIKHVNARLFPWLFKFLDKGESSRVNTCSLGGCFYMHMKSILSYGRKDSKSLMFL